MPVLAILSGILLAALGLRLPLLFESVWFDELYLSNLALGQPIHLLRTLYVDIHPPLYFLFMAGWNRVFGDAEISLRLPSLLFGLLSILLIYRLGRIHAGRSAGLAAALIAALSPVHIWYSQEARPYAAMIFLVTLVAWAFQRLHLPGTRRRHWWAYGVGLFAVVFIHYYMTAYLVMLTLLTLARRSPHRRRLLWIHGVLFGLMGAFVAAKVALSDFSTGRAYLRPFSPDEVAPFFFNWLGLGNGFTPLHVETPPVLQHVATAFQILVALAAARGLWVLWRSWRGAGEGEALEMAPPHHLLLLMVTVPGFLFVLPHLGLEKTYIERSLLTSLPFFHVLLGAGLTGLRGVAVRRSVHALAGVVMVSALAAHFIHRDEWTVYKPNPDWRGVVETLRPRLDSDRDLVLFCAYPSPQALTYYDARIQERARMEDVSHRSDKVSGLVLEVLGEGDLAARVQRFLDDQQGAFARWQEEQRRNARLWVHRMESYSRDAIPESGAFYLLIHPPDEGHPRIQGVLKAPGTRVLRRWDFRRLKLFELSVHDDDEPQDR